MKNKLVGILFLLVLVATAGSAFYFQFQYAKAKNEIVKLKKQPNKVAEKEAKELVDRVGKLIDLPKGEIPSVATITDVTKLDAKKQPFFTRAANNDKVLIFVQAKKAFLYRPSTNKIIEVGFINTDQNQEQVAGESIEVRPTVVLSPTTAPSPRPTLTTPTPTSQ